MPSSTTTATSASNILQQEGNIDVNTSLATNAATTKKWLFFNDDFEDDVSNWDDMKFDIDAFMNNNNNNNTKDDDGKEDEEEGKKNMEGKRVQYFEILKNQKSQQEEQERLLESRLHQVNLSNNKSLLVGSTCLPSSLISYKEFSRRSINKKQCQ
jgi:hypothetical protein